jgi:hypothetical protein
MRVLVHAGVKIVVNAEAWRLPCLLDEMVEKL